MPLEPLPSYTSSHPGGTSCHPWNELDLPRCNFSPIRQKMSHHLSYIFLYCHPHNRLSQDRLEPITSSSSRASRECETKIWKRLKTEGLNALHMNTQNAARCTTLIRKHFSPIRCLGCPVHFGTISCQTWCILRNRYISLDSMIKYQSIEQNTAE